MVDFSTKQTNLSAPDLKGATHVSAPITDSSKAIGLANMGNLIKGAGELAFDVYKSSKVADINEETQKDIADYMRMRGNPEEAKSSLSDAASTDIQTTVFKPQGEQLSAVENAQKERLNTYQKALAEGVMTPDEFSDRVLANLREATNKNPGLYNELKQEAARVLELSGITGVIKSDQLIAESKQKQAENLLKDMQDRAKREHIYYDATTGYWDLAEKVKAAENDTQSYDLQVRGKERFSMLSQEQARSWVQNKGNDVVRGSLSNSNKTLQSFIDTNAVDSSNYPKFKVQFEGQLDNMHQVFVDSIPVNIRQDPLVQENIKLHADGLERVKTRLSNLATGEDMKKVLTNEYEILKLRQDTRLRETVDIASLEMATKMAAAVPGIITQSDSYRKSIFDAAVAISEGGFSSPAVKGLVPKSDKDKRGAVLLEGVINQSLSDGDFVPLTKTLQALNSQTSSIENPKTRLQYLYNNINTIARQKPMSLDVTSIQEVETTIGQLLTDSNFGINTLSQTTQGKKVKMDVLPSGQLMFIGEDSAKFNSIYANNVNMALQAYANAHNTSIKDAAKLFYPKYFGSFVSNGDSK